MLTCLIMSSQEEEGDHEGCDDLDEGERSASPGVEEEGGSGDCCTLPEDAENLSSPLLSILGSLSDTEEKEVDDTSLLPPITNWWDDLAGWITEMISGDTISTYKVINKFVSFQ